MGSREPNWEHIRKRWLEGDPTTRELIQRLYELYSEEGEDKEEKQSIADTKAIKAMKIVGKTSVKLIAKVIEEYINGGGF